MIKLYIETGNSAFEDENKNLEVARIISGAAEKVCFALWFEIAGLQREFCWRID